MTTIENVELHKIKASFGNDRTVFDTAAISDLADSIRVNGLAQPITLRPVVDGYQIIAGERRYRAHCLLNEQLESLRDLFACFGMDFVNPVTSIRAIVQPMTDETAAAIMLAENTGRKDLDPVDEANAYRRRMNEYSWDEKTVAEKAGVSVQIVRNRLKLLTLRDDLQHLVRTNALPMGYAQIIAESELDKNRQMIAFQRLQQNPTPTQSWLRKECAELATQQAQTDMFSGLMESTFSASVKVAPVKVKPPADPRTDKAPMTGNTYQDMIRNQVDFWNHAADQWDRYGKSQQRDRCLAASKALIDILAVMPKHGNKGKKAKQGAKSYMVYELASV